MPDPQLQVAPPIVDEVLHSSGQPLDTSTREFMESRFGHDFSRVRVHTDSRAGGAASIIGARAFTVNRDIVFGSGEYVPQTESGRHLLAHELTHVAQQAGVASALSVADVPLVLGGVHDPAEGEARRAADEVARGGFAPIQASRANAAVILREPVTTPQQAPKGDRVRLQKLFAAVKATSVGKKFLSFANGEPNLVWGNTGALHGNFDSNDTITLNEMEEKQLSDCQWQQVIAMELGNFANAALFDPVFDKCDKGTFSKDDFVDAIEKIEFDSRNLVLDAYDNGEFGAPGSNCSSVFPGGRVSFQEYLKAPGLAIHRASYEDYWEQNCKKSYLKKHPTK